MAVINDVLETILQLSGIASYVAGMRAASTSTLQLAAAQTTLATTSGAAGAGIAVAAASVAELVAGLAAIGVLLAGAQGLRQFASDEQVWVKLARALHNVGGSLPFAEVKAYAEARQVATGIDDEATGALIRQLVQLRFNTKQWQELVPVLQDAEAAGKGTAESIALAIRRFLTTGRAAGLAPLGIDINKVKQEADQLGEIIRELRAASVGSVDDQFKTLKGGFDDLLHQLGNLFSSIGDALTPVVLPIIHAWRDEVIAVTRFINDTLDRLGVPRQSQIDADRIARTATQKGFDEKDSDNLGRIAANTAETAGIVRQMLGGPGTLGPPSASIRVLRDAFSRG